MGSGRSQAPTRPDAAPWQARSLPLPSSLIPTIFLDGLNDSKQLSIARREELFDLILSSSIVSIASSAAGRIDDTDIRKASLDAMRRAVFGLSMAPALVLADGRDIPPGLACMGKAVVKGDARSLSIAAASIIAKVARDRMMTRADLVFPAYGFATHAGYATQRIAMPSAITAPARCIG
jgi:ribonuclease HII